MFCTSCGAQVAPGSAFCSQCGKPLAAAQQSGVSLDKADPAPMERPGQMGDFDVPPGVAGWSWGAFLFNWIWAIGNRTWIGLLALVPYIGFFVAIWLGFKGREMAWRARSWDGVEHFNRVQKRWSYWAVGVLLAVVVLGIATRIMAPDSMSDEQDGRAASGMAQEDDVFVDAGGDTAGAGTRIERGRIDSHGGSLPTRLMTSAGTLERRQDRDGQRYMTLSGTPLFDGEDAQWQFPVRSFSLSNDREAVLMASSGGRGNSCETLFFFLLIDGGKVQSTPLFGTCAPQGSYRQRGDVIALELPKMGGASQIVLRDGEVIEDGRTITLDNLNDPAK